jgi:hypothetical protein
MSSSRLLWQPLWPQVASLLRSVPDYPFEATLAAIALTPVCLPLACILPFVLVCDAALQKMYDRWGGPLEVLWEDVGGMLHIALDSAALAGKEGIRVVNQTVRG